VRNHSSSTKTNTDKAITTELAPREGTTAKIDA
jgi:hypothetical protein